MKAFLAILGLLCALTPGICSASITYEWKTVKQGYPDNFIVSLEFDEATVASGSYSLTLNRGDRQADSDTGLISMRVRNFSLLPRINPIDGEESFLNIHVSFLSDGFLTGSFSGLSYDTEFRLSTGLDERTFTVNRYGSDALGINCFLSADECNSTTGQIRRIPEPASLFLFGVGAIAALGMRRRIK